MNKIYLATESHLDSQDQALTQINAKLTPIDLGSVETAIVDFVHDPITITSGGLDQYNRRITT